MAGCKRNRKGFSRHYNLNQHYRRVHGRSIRERDPQNQLQGAGVEDTRNDTSTMEIDGSKESTPFAAELDSETPAQGSDQPSVALNPRIPTCRNDTPVQIIQAELHSLKSQRLESVRRLDEGISTLEAALAIMRRGL